MNLFRIFKKYFTKCKNLIIFIFCYKLKFKFILSKKSSAIFFCGNPTIGDNVILLSLIKPYLESHKTIKKIYYFGNEKNLKLLLPLYGEFNDKVVWKKIKLKKFSYLVDNPTILSRIIRFCNSTNRSFHSIFYLQERIPKDISVIEYHKSKMGINTDVDVYLPHIEDVKNEKAVVLNIESQSISASKIKNIAEEIIEYFNKRGIQVYVNSKTRDLKGEYNLVFPNLHDFLVLIQSTLAFVSIRSGITDLACSTSTNILAIYGDKKWSTFSLSMWPKKTNRKIIEITENEFDINILEELIS